MLNESETKKLIASLNDFYSRAHEEQIVSIQKKFQHWGAIASMANTLDYNNYGICPTCELFVSTQDISHRHNN